MTTAHIIPQPGSNSFLVYGINSKGWPVHSVVASEIEAHEWAMANGFEQVTGEILLPSGLNAIFED